MAADPVASAGDGELEALGGTLAKLRVSAPSPLPWWLAELDKRVSDAQWSCTCTGICQRGILTGHAMCNHARRAPDAVYAVLCPCALSCARVRCAVARAACTARNRVPSTSR